MRNKNTTSVRHRSSRNQEQRVESQLITTSSHGSPVPAINNGNFEATTGTNCKLPPNKEMSMKKKTTAATTETTTMVTPRPMDVRLGRGKSFSIHLGNNILHELVASYRLEYMSSLNLRKREITTEIVNTIHTKGGRFIKQCGDHREMWLIVSAETARQKVAHAMQYVIRTGQNPLNDEQRQRTSALTAAQKSRTPERNELPSPLASFAPQDIDRYREFSFDMCYNSKSKIVLSTDGIDCNSYPCRHHCHHPVLLSHQQFASTANRPLQNDSVQPLNASLFSLYRLRSIAAQRIDRCSQQQEHELKLLYKQHPLSRIYCHPYRHDIQRLSQQDHDHFSYISNSNYINESNQSIEYNNFSVHDERQTEKINDIPLDNLFHPTNPNSISIHEVAPRCMRTYILGNERIPSQTDSFVPAISSIFERAGFVKSPPVPVTFQASCSKKTNSNSSCGDILEQSKDNECCNESINSALSFDALDLSGIGSLNEYDFTASAEECANKSVCLQ